MNIFIDTEFTGFDHESELISIGLVAGNPQNASLYLEIADFDRRKCSDFVRAHVLPLLEGEDKSKDFQTVALTVWDWLAELAKSEPLKFVIDYTGDWQWLLGLLSCAHQCGRPSVIPPGVSHEPLYLLAMIDLQATDGWGNLSNSYAQRHGLRVHHALDDALRNKLIYEHAPRCKPAEHP